MLLWKGIQEPPLNAKHFSYTRTRAQVNIHHSEAAQGCLCQWFDIAQVIKGKLVLMSKANLFMLIVFMGDLSITLINTVCLIGK